jgi:hypothetical protein
LSSLQIAALARARNAAPFSSTMPSGTPTMGPNGPVWGSGANQTAPTVGPVVSGTPGNYTTSETAGTYQTGPGAGGTGGPTAGQVGGVISGLASGLTQAAQTYANSVKPWTVQKSAIPNPPAAPSAPAAQFSQPQAQTQPQQQQNPYMTAYAMGLV